VAKTDVYRPMLEVVRDSFHPSSRYIYPTTSQQPFTISQHPSLSFHRVEELEKKTHRRL